MLKAIIFDFDDIIVDTAKLKYHAYSKVLRAHGIEITEEEYVSEWLKTGSGVRAALARSKGKLDFESFRREGTQEYLNILEKRLRAIDGAIETLDAIQLKKGLGSNSKEEHVAYCLDRLKIRDKFDVIVTGSDVSKPKPDPEIYRTVADLLGVKPEECLVVDDHTVGIKAAKAAGMTAVAIPHGYTQDQDFSQADYILKSIRDLPTLLEKLNAE